MKDMRDRRWIRVGNCLLEETPELLRWVRYERRRKAWQRVRQFAAACWRFLTLR